MMPQRDSIPLPTERTQDLSALTRALHQAILYAFPQLGGPPDDAWVQNRATRLGIAPAQALRELAEHDLIHCDPATGSIVAAYPFSGIRTPHRVEVEGGKPVYAMCAVDALGIPLMLDADAAVSSSDPISGESIRVLMRGGNASWDPPEAVVFVGRLAASGPAAQCICPVLNFFTSAAAAQTYQQAHPELEGSVYPPVEAIEAAQKAFGNLLGATPLASTGSYQGYDPLPSGGGNLRL